MFRFPDSYAQFTPVTAEHRRQQVKLEERARFRIDLFHHGLAFVGDLALVFLPAGFCASTLRFMVLACVLDQWLLAFLLMLFLPHLVPLSMVCFVKRAVRVRKASVCLKICLSSTRHESSEKISRVGSRSVLQRWRTTHPSVCKIGSMLRTEQ